MFVELKLMRIRRREQKKLSAENLTEFKYIKHYISESTLSFYEKEEVLQQILDTMLQAQAENKSIHLFIGNDINGFCDSIIMEYRTSKSFMLKTINFIEQLIIWISLWISLDMLFKVSPYFELGSIISATLFCCISFIFIQKSELKGEPKSYLKMFGVYFIAAFIMHALMDFLDINEHNNISLYSTKNIFIIAILLVFIWEIYKIRYTKQKLV